MLGAPGSGKGTQSARLAEYLSVPNLSTGALFRSVLDTDPGSQLGVAADVIRSGGLVDDTIVMQVVTAKILELEFNVVLDGFPRTENQAHLFSMWLEDNHRRIDYVIYLRVPMDELIIRLGSRRTCKRCGFIASLRLEDADTGIPCPRCCQDLVRREDDRPASISRRLAIYEAVTAPLRDYYGTSGELIMVNGAAEPDLVYRDICNLVNNPV